jgi:CrcB protein
MNSLAAFVYVGLGGMLGSLLRYTMTLLFSNVSWNMPGGTLVSNLAGCFLIGVVTTLSVDLPVLSSQARLFLATGICGGFTTLSSLVYELGQQLRDGEYAAASVYFLVTFMGAFCAFFAGAMLTKVIYKG